MSDISTYSNFPEKPLSLQDIKDMVKLLKKDYDEPFQKFAKSRGFDLNAGDILIISKDLVEKYELQFYNRKNIFITSLFDSHIFLMKNPYNIAER